MGKGAVGKHEHFLPSCCIKDKLLTLVFSLHTLQEVMNVYSYSPPTPSCSEIKHKSFSTASLFRTCVLGNTVCSKLD